MPAPLDPTKRAAIAAALREREQPKLNQLAREFGVSPDTISRIAKTEGVTFERTATKNATAAKQADNAARRAELSQRLLDRAVEALGQMDSEFLVFNFGGRDNTYAEHRLDRPPTGDLRNLMTVAAIAVDKHLAIERHDSDGGEGLAAVDAWLRHTLGIE